MNYNRVCVRAARKQGNPFHADNITLEAKVLQIISCAMQCEKERENRFLGTNFCVARRPTSTASSCARKETMYSTSLCRKYNEWPNLDRPIENDAIDQS